MICAAAKGLPLPLRNPSPASSSAIRRRLRFCPVFGFRRLTTQSPILRYNRGPLRTAAAVHSPAVNLPRLRYTPKRPTAPGLEAHHAPRRRSQGL